MWQSLYSSDEESAGNRSLGKKWEHFAVLLQEMAGSAVHASKLLWLWGAGPAFVNGEEARAPRWSGAAIN